VETVEAARRWADVWSRAWPAGDVEAIDALYADDAVFYSHPFRDRQAPREYVESVFSDQAEAECRFGVPIVSGNSAAVDWWGVITSLDGTTQTVAGTSLLNLDEDGRVVEQRDAWGERAGRHELPHWAR